MAGAPTPAIPLVAPIYRGPIPVPSRRRGPNGCPPASSTLNNQGPPHGITPLVGPDIAHSSPFGIRPRQTSREAAALNASLADIEGILSRQESELNSTRSQLSALRSETATRQKTLFVDQAHMDALINQSRNDRARDIDRQFQILDNRLDQASEDLERAEGNHAALQGLQYAIQKDRRDIQDLRQIVAAAEFNLQRQKRLAGAEDRFKGLVKNLDLMLAAAMQATRGSQVKTRGAPTAESSTHPLEIARRHVVESQEPGSHRHAFGLHPQELGKGKERDPGLLLSEGPDADSDAPNHISMNDTGQELAAAPLQGDGFESTDEDWVMPDAPDTNTINIANDFYLEHLNGEDVDMDWDEEPVTILNKDDPAAPSQASSDYAPLIPSLNVNAEIDVVMIPAPTSNAMAPPSDSVHQDAAVEPSQPASQAPKRTRRRQARSSPYHPYHPYHGSRVRRVRRVRRTRHVRQMVIESVNMPLRKRTADVEESGVNKYARKRRLTKEIVECSGSRLLSLSEEYAMDIAARMPVMSVPAVTQPTQTSSQYTEGVSTEQVPNEAARSAPAVPQPTQAALESTEQVPIDADLSEPAVSKPTQAVSEKDETIETMQVPTEVAVSAPAVPQPTQAAFDSTLLVPVSNVSSEVAGAPAPSEPAPTKSDQPMPLWTERIRSVRAVTKPTLNESDQPTQFWTERIRSARAVTKPTPNESDRVVPNQWIDTHARIEAMRARRVGRVRPREVMYALKGLQVTATSRKKSTSSLVASPEDASAKNAVATGAESRAGDSEGTKRVEDSESPPCSDQKTAGDLQEEMDGEEATTSGLQMPGAWPSDPPFVTASGESDMHGGSALLRRVWTGTRWASFGVLAMVMVILLSFPLWLDHLEHLVYAFEGPERFLEELREEHGYVPFLEWIIYVFLRSFAGDRTLFG